MGVPVEDLPDPAETATHEHERGAAVGYTICRPGWMASLYGSDCASEGGTEK